MIGLAIVEFKPLSSAAILEDIIIDQRSRSRNAGGVFLKWIEKEIITKGMSFIFLESGISNSKAHNFFRRNGYQKSSIVMFKKL